MDILEKVSELTGVPVGLVKRLFNAYSEVIRSDLYQQKNNSETFYKVDVPTLGEVHFVKDLSSDKCEIHFNKNIKSILKDVQEATANPMVTKLEKKLIQRVLQTYKDLI